MSQSIRAWNVIAQEKGDPSEQRQEAGDRKSELTNLYTVSYTPISVSSEDTKYGGNDPITVRFYFVLDVAKLEFNGQKPASSGPAKKRTVGSFAEGSDPQTTLPKQDASGKRVNSYSLPEQFRPDMPSPPTPGELVPGKLSLLVVSQQLWEGDNSVSDTASLSMMPARQTGDDTYELYSLSIGETGSFPVNMVGIMEEDERKKEAGQALLDELPESTEECSCSCETLEKFTLRQKQLEAEFKPGDQPPMDEIMRMSNCFQSCMSEFMQCR